MHVYSEGAYINQAINSETIEPLNKGAVIKICYGVLDRDIELEYYIGKLCDRHPKLPVRVLLKIAIYNILYLNKAPHAVTDNAVELCKKLGKGGMSGFLNAVLRSYIRISPIDFPKDKIKNLSVRYSYPEFAVRHLINDYGEETAVSIMSAENPGTYLRFKKGIDGADYLKKLGREYGTTPFPNCFLLKNFIREEGFFRGDYTFMSVGSIAVCDAVEAKPDANLLDCCAAPGGKSVYLAEKFKSVTANDLHPHRVELIKSYAKRMGAENITAEVADSTVYNPAFEQKFDAVLCDSPCSGLGVANEKPDIKLNRSEEDLKGLVKTQSEILKNVCRYVKKGGFLYYSTCSVLKCENEDIIAGFLSSRRDFAEIKLTSPFPFMQKEYGLQFLPHLSCGAGFYICKLKKI